MILQRKESNVSDCLTRSLSIDTTFQNNNNASNNISNTSAFVNIQPTSNQRNNPQMVNNNHPNNQMQNKIHNPDKFHDINQINCKSKNEIQNDYDEQNFNECHNNSNDSRKFPLTKYQERQNLVQQQQLHQPFNQNP